MQPNKIKVGMKVNYHSIISGPVTKENCIVTQEPWLPKSWKKCHGMVTMITDVRGWVHCDGLSEVKE